MREEEEEREEGMLFFSFLLLSTSRDLSQLDSEDIIIHHRETKEQENIYFDQNDAQINKSSCMKQFIWKMR